MMEKEPPEPVNPLGTVLVGNLEPDMMDTPKELVRKALKRAGFKTVDAGRGCSATNFAKKAKESNADVIAVSINLSSAKENLQKLRDAIDNEGLMDKVNIMIGGAAVTKDDADKICAAYGKTKEEAVAIAKQFIEVKKSK